MTTKIVVYVTLVIFIWL